MMKIPSYTDHVSALAGLSDDQNIREAFSYENFGQFFNSWVQFLRIFTTQWSMREHEDNWAAKDMLLRLLGDDSNFYADLICTAHLSEVKQAWDNCLS